jgi:branched-chain amino acid transport system substrate-binding protein
VPVIIGAFGSSVTLAIAPVAERNKVVLISASSTADKIRDAGDYIFRNVPPNARQAQTAVEFCLERLKAKRAAILYINNDYGISLRDEFKRRFQRAGGSIVAVEAYNPGARDFRSQLVKIKAAGPTVVFYPGHYQESGLILKQAKELGLKATFVGGDGSFAPELIQIAGNAAEGSYYTMMAMGYGVADEEIKKFVTAFKRKYGEEPSVYAAYAYDALKLIADAIRRGGYTADGIKNALYETKDFKGVTGITRFDKNGEVDKPFYIYEVKKGKFQLTDWIPGGDKDG